MFLAPEYHFYQALVWVHPSNSPVKRHDSNVIENYDSMMVHGSSTIMADIPSELYIYSLWHDALCAAPMHQLSSLTLPLLPVLVGSQRILIAANVAPYILFDIPHRQEDMYREHLQHDIDVRCENERIETERMLLVMKKLAPPVANCEATTCISTETMEQAMEPTASQPTEQFIPHIISDTLRAILTKLRVPFLDCNIFESPPLAMTEAMATAQELGHRLLATLAYFTEKNIFVYDPQTLEATSMLKYELLSETERTALLVEMFHAHQHTPFTDGQVAQVKSLPLFGTRDGRVVRINGFTEVYWYASDKVLRHMSSSTMPALNNNTVILTPHKELNQLYLQLGAVELTPHTILKKFTIPLMSTMDPDVRIGVLDDMSKQWSNYNSDKEVVELLKAVEFIPCRSNDGKIQYLSAGQVLSWYNRELMETLAGADDFTYFPPVELRYFPVVESKPCN